MTDRNAFARHRILLIDDNRAIHQDFRKIFGAARTPNRWMRSRRIFWQRRRVQSEESVPDRFCVSGSGRTRAGAKAQADGDPYAMAFVDVRMPPGWKWHRDHRADLGSGRGPTSGRLHRLFRLPWDEMHEKLGRSDRLVILKKPFDNVEVLQLAEALTVKWSLLQQTRQHLQELESTIAKRTEQLRKSEEHFRLIAENVTDLIAIVDPQGRRIYNSPSHERLLGYSPDELQTSLAFTQIHPEDRAGVIAAARELIEAGASNVLEYRMRHKDGSWRTLESHGAPFRTATGQIEGVLTGGPGCHRAQTRGRIFKRLGTNVATGVGHHSGAGVLEEPAPAYLGCNRLFARDAGFDSPADLVGKLDTELVWHEQAEQYRSDDRQFIELGRRGCIMRKSRPGPTAGRAFCEPAKFHCGIIAVRSSAFWDFTKTSRSGSRRNWPLSGWRRLSNPRTMPSSARI